MSNSVFPLPCKPTNSIVEIIDHHIALYECIYKRKPPIMFLNPTDVLYCSDSAFSYTNDCRYFRDIPYVFDDSIVSGFVRFGNHQDYKKYYIVPDYGLFAKS